AARTLERFEAGLDAGIAVAHGPIDLDAGVFREQSRDPFRLAARDRAKRRLIAFPIPDRPVRFAGAERPLCEHDGVEHEPPDRGIDLDNAPVGKEFFQIAAHGPIARSLRRPEIDEKHAYASIADSRVSGGRSSRYAWGRRAVRQFIHAAVSCARGAAIMVSRLERTCDRPYSPGPHR